MVPLSISKRLARGGSKGRISRHALVRFWWMVLFGWWIHINLLTRDLQQMRLSYSVLMMLAFSYVIAVALVLWTTLPTQIIVTAGILVGYWAVQMFVPVPGHVMGQFELSAHGAVPLRDDVKGWRKCGGGLFVTLGSNSILADLTAALFMGVFTAPATPLFAGLKLCLSAYRHGVWMTVAKFGLA